MTTIRYRLPAELGGGEYEGELNSTSTVATLTVPGVGDIEVPGTCVTIVAPPLPPEPPNGTVVLDHEGDAWQRRGSWRSANDKDDRVLERGWGLLNEEFGPLTRLVPDPAHDAPALPLRLKDADGTLIARVEPSDANKDRIFIDIQYTHLTRGQAHEIAVAVWAWAAREVEQP